jgi:hypothetical protein
MASPVAITPILSRIFQWLATHWLAILKAIAVAVGVSIAGITIWRYIEVTGRPEVQQVTASVVAITQAVVPLMFNFMLMHLMLTFVQMFREMVPRREEVR